MDLLISFDDLKAGASALRKLTQAFTRAGTPVATSDVDPKAGRTSGVSYRRVALTMTDNQKVELLVKTTGDIYEVRINGSRFPVKNQTDQRKAIGEIAKALDAGRAKYQAKLARQKVVLPKGIKTAAPKLEQRIAQEREALTVQVAEAEAKVAELRAIVGEDAGERPAGSVWKYSAETGFWHDTGAASLEEAREDDPDGAYRVSSDRPAGSPEAGDYALDGVEDDEGGPEFALDDAGNRIPYNPKTDRWRSLPSGSKILIRGDRVIGGAGGKLNTPETKKLHTVSSARYAKGKNVVRTKPNSSGFKGNSAAMAEAVGGKYSRREDGYIMSAAQTKAMESLLNAGAEASHFTGKISFKDGPKDLSYKEAKAHAKKAGLLDSAELAAMDEVEAVLDAVDVPLNTFEMPEVIAGIEVAKQVESGALLDSGDFDRAIATMQVALDVAEANHPVNVAEGNLEQAENEEQLADQLRGAIEVLKSKVVAS